MDTKKEQIRKLEEKPKYFFPRIQDKHTIKRQSKKRKAEAQKNPSRRTKFYLIEALEDTIIKSF